MFCRDDECVCIANDALSIKREEALGVATGPHTLDGYDNVSVVSKNCSRSLLPVVNGYSLPLSSGV